MQGYVQYLQNLLKEKGVEYQTEQEFLLSSQKKEEFVAGPLETNMKQPLFGSLLARYSRQMLLKQIKYQGQFKISSAKVALIGAGGIGCPLGLYLAGAGVGTLGLFDSDCVDMTNLHRQIGHSTATLNQPKTKSLKATLLNLNPNININEHPFIRVQTLHLLDDYDLVIDGSDNPQCRYLVNDYLMSKNRKLLSGACVGWEGQVTCYGDSSPCYRCIWGDDQVSMGGCSTLGVLGMLPGLVAMLLAIQAVKIIVNGKSSLQGSLLTFEGKSCTFRKMKLRNKKEQCLACGQNKLNIQEYNYEKYGGCSTQAIQLPQVVSITWDQFVKKVQSKPQIKIIDVRPQAQYDIINFKNSINVPLENLTKMNEEQIEKQFGQKNNQIYVSCRSGVASKRGTNFLISKGYENVINIEGGINKYGSIFNPNIVSI